MWTTTTVTCDMKKWQIWSEGYLATGMEGIPAKAICHATDVEAETFHEACFKWWISQDPVHVGYIAFHPHEDGVMINGYTGYFDNEADARKAFG